MNLIEKMSDSEWVVMKTLWDNEGIMLNDMVELLREEKGWNKNTIHTFLTRLEKKELVRIDKSSIPHKFFSHVTKHESVREETKSFMNKVYDGSVKLLLSNFVKDRSLSKEDIDELKKILEEGGDS